MIDLFFLIFLGLIIGANDTANCIAPAVESRTISLRYGTVLVAFFIVLGAFLEGSKMSSALKIVEAINPLVVFLALFSALIPASLATLKRYPISTSQTIMGGLVGSSFVLGTAIKWGFLSIIIATWFITPLVTAVFSYLLCYFLNRIIIKLTFVEWDHIFRWLLVLSGAYLGYSLGANTVGLLGEISTSSGNLSNVLAGTSTGIGALFFSFGVLKTVGGDIVNLDPFTAVVVQFSSAFIVHVFTQVGIPISLTQAVVGSVLGIGLLKGIGTINLQTTYRVFGWWALTPGISAILGMFFSVLFMS